MTEPQHGVKQQLHNIFLLFSLTCPATQAPNPLYENTGRGKQPVTWTTLIEVLHHIELFNLAGDIRTSKCPSEQWNGCMEIQHLYIYYCVHGVYLVYPTNTFQCHFVFTRASSFTNTCCLWDLFPLPFVACYLNHIQTINDSSFMFIIHGCTV